MKIYKVKFYFPDTKGYTFKYFNTNKKDLIINWLKENDYKNINFEIKNISPSKEYYNIDL